MRKTKKTKVTRKSSRVVRRKPSRSSSFRSFLPLLIVVGVLGLGYLGFRLFFRPQSVDINQITGGTGTVVLALTPSSITKDANQTTAITLTINSGTSKATGVQIEIAYNPTKCVTPTVTKGDFFSETLMAATVAGGRIKFAYGIHPTAEGKTGTGTVATITTGPKNDDCTLTFVNNMNKNLATVEGVNTNALASASDAVIHLTGNSPTPTPSVTPTPTPSPSGLKTPSCPTRYTPAECTAFQTKVTSLQNLYTSLNLCIQAKSLNYCRTKTVIDCLRIKPVASCLNYY